VLGLCDLTGVMQITGTQLSSSFGEFPLIHTRQ